ncbi:type I pullulanase [Candidatus Xianfuyuplasma coldseepsis]|uniref:Type I pullulanase n=1 Tax=Candidatus Xianfuyuplasma coldseepsis TaxID=2782163 RepID=A0A7L7KQF9_9MOLU|nr:type I pullulanase [Xianfuyuplasma coldseepsis]QMS84456.1 type I pullulanase [Xianfuyuplasma coldseepsis]
MNKTYYSYLDDFSQITILVPTSYRHDFVKSFTVIGNDEEIELDIISSEMIGNERKYITRFDGYILLNQMYHIYDDLNNTSELFTGKIVRTELFDDIYYYEQSDLGSSYRKDRTKFKIWTPVAKYMKLELLSPDGTHEIVPMEYDNQGVWYLRLKGDYETYKYRYISYVNGKEHTLTDPYGQSSNANGEWSYVIDESKLYKMRQQRPKFSGIPTDAVIYETHIRDFTKHPSLQATHPGKYASFTEQGLTTKEGYPAGIDHVLDLGITHIQLMPVYDFGSTDERNPENTYNWGYDPAQYNVPEGSFSSDPDDPYKRINELRKVIDDIHGLGLRVSMDVVYNHVYNHKLFAFEKIIPGYGYRFDNQGMMTDSSGCGNDVASERRMVRKFIIDSILFWAKEYKMDAFRFDLMGLLDIRTMNTLRQKLDRFRSDIIVYGEGWRMPTVIGDDFAAHMYNKHLLFNIGHFNDKTRELIKGATFDIKQRGYALGSSAKLDDIKNIIMGSCMNKFLFRYPTQSINYVECHDNNTFYDKAVIALGKDVTDDEIKRRQRLATSIVILSQGVPFIHSGQEFYRSKQGVENSYKSSDSINQINWDLIDENMRDINVVKELLRIRKKYDLFRLTAPSKIRDYVTIHTHESGTIRYELEDEETKLIVIFKNNTTKETFNLDDKYTLIFDGRKRSRRLLTKINVDEISTYILKRK